MLQDFIEKLFNLNYSINTFQSKKHELNIINIFNEFNIIESPLEYFTILKNKDNINKIIDIKGNYYINQPFGSQKSPDFIVVIEGLVLWIECKTGNKKITWNSGYPNKEILYVFSCKKNNTTTLFFGKFHEVHLNDNFVELYEQFDKKLKEIAKNEFTFKTVNIDYYNRRMLIDKTNYSEPFIRKEMYIKTLNYINGRDNNSDLLKLDELKKLNSN